MIDFLRIATRTGKHGVIEVYPNFIITKSKDLMIRGSDFYAIWLEERGLWSTEEQDALQLIDRELDIYANEHKQFLGDNIRVLHMWDAQSGMIDIWHKYCQRQMRDNYHKKGTAALHAASIKNVIFNPPATVVYWSDGTKTVVKCSVNDKFDPEKGLAMAIAKRCANNSGSYYKEIQKWVGEEPCYYETSYVLTFIFGGMNYDQN